MFFLQLTLTLHCEWPLRLNYKLLNFEVKFAENMISFENLSSSVTPFLHLTIVHKGIIVNGERIYTTERKKERKNLYNAHLVQKVLN